MTRTRSSIAFGIVLAGCGTLATEAGDLDAERPNAIAGPFRLLAADEIDGLNAPYVLRKKFWDFRQPTVLVEEPGTVLGAASLYALATETGVSAVYRFVAPDGRSFEAVPDPPTPVLAAGAESLDAPEVARVGDEIRLYYSTPSGIHVARSNDGVSFTPDPNATLGAGGAGWEGGQAPRAPAFLTVGPGDHRLFYEVQGRIGEARSSDGLSWERVGAGPVLEPGPDLAGEPPFDGGGVGDPEALRVRSAEGRWITRLYYTGRGSDGSTGIGLAARFGDQGPMTRATAPALTGPRGPRAPALVPQGSFTLLFFEQAAGTNDDWPAIAAGIAPATRRIPVP